MLQEAAFSMVDSLSAHPFWAAATALLAWLVASNLAMRINRRADEPPLVRGWLPFFGVAFSFGKSPRKFIDQCTAKYGSVFSLYIAGKRMTFLTDALHPPVVFKGARQLSFQPIQEEFRQRVFGCQPLEQQFTDEIHQLFPPCLQGAQLEAMTDRMAERLYSFFDTMNLLRAGAAPSAARPTDSSSSSPAPLVRFDSASGLNTASLYRFCAAAIFYAASQVVFGDGFCGGDLGAFEHFLSFEKRVTALVAGIPKAFVRDIDQHRSWISKLFPVGRDNVCELVKRRNGILDTAGLSEEQKGPYQMVMLYALQHNTMTVAFWTAAHLLGDPRAAQAILDELKTVAGDSSTPLTDANGRLRLESTLLRKLALLESAINESLRLCSSVMIIRRALDTFDFPVPVPAPGPASEGPAQAEPAGQDEGVKRKHETKDYHIRKGDLVCLFTESIHRDAEIYSDPDRFVFDRFVTPNPEFGKVAGAPRHTARKFFKRGEELRYFLFPFGGGVSYCPGRFFAFNEIKLLVLQLLWHFECTLAPGQTVPAIKPGIGTRPPLNDVEFRFRLRTPVSC